MSKPAYDLPIDVEWPQSLEDVDWRMLQDLEQDAYEDDEDLPASAWLVEALGFDPDEEDDLTENVFCPTGDGGGVDPTCAPGKDGGINAIRVDEFVHKGGTKEELSSIYRLAAEQTRLQKLYKSNPNDQVKSKLDSTKNELDEIRQRIRDRYASIHGRAAEKALTMAKAVEMTKKQRGEKKPREGFTLEQARRMDIAALEAAAVPHVAATHARTGRVLDTLSIKVNGVEINWEPGLTHVAKQGIDSFADIHPELMQYNTSVTFVKQAYVDSGPDFNTYATANAHNRSVVFYNGEFGGGASTMAHESAHNMATAFTGSSFPLRSSGSSRRVKGKKVKIDLTDRKDEPGDGEFYRRRVINAVTEYGKTNKAEDFAEFVAAYSELQRGRPYRGIPSLDYLKEVRPTTFATVQRMLGDAE